MKHTQQLKHFEKFQACFICWRCFICWFKMFHLLCLICSFPEQVSPSLVGRLWQRQHLPASGPPPPQRRRRHPLASGLPLPPSVDTITQPAPSPLLPPSQILTWIGSVLFCHFMCKPRHGRSYNFDCTVDRHLLAWRICPRTHGRPISKDRCFVDLFKSCLSKKVK